MEQEGAEGISVISAVTSGGWLAQQPGQQRYKGNADQRNAAARDKLLDPLAFTGRVVLAVTFQQVHAAPYAKGTAEANNDSL